MLIAVNRQSCDLSKVSTMDKKVGLVIKRISCEMMRNFLLPGVDSFSESVQSAPN